MFERIKISAATAAGVICNLAWMFVGALSWLVNAMSSAFGIIGVAAVVAYWRQIVAIAGVIAFVSWMWALAGVGAGLFSLAICGLAGTLIWLVHTNRI